MRCHDNLRRKTVIDYAITIAKGRVLVFVECVLSSKHFTCISHCNLSAIVGGRFDPQVIEEDKQAPSV